jgi:hypothetical protein
MNLQKDGIEKVSFIIGSRTIFLNTLSDLETVNYGKPFTHPFTHDLRCMAKFSEETIVLLLRNCVIS